MTTPVSAVLSLKEAAAYLRLGEKEVRRLCASGELPAFLTRGGGAWRVPRASCDQYIARQLDERMARLHAGSP